MAIPRGHILYIEDHEDTRELVVIVLAESNCLVTTTCTISDALKLARAHQFDLYLIDSWLPDGAGIELCKQLREFDPTTPIMFLSGLAYDADKQAALDHGAQRYLVKPADIQVLSKEVNSLIDLTSKNYPAETFTDSHPLVRRDTGRPVRLDVLDLEVVVP
jgi:DNA-binding response OmpR family regulator